MLAVDQTISTGPLVSLTVVREPQPEGGSNDELLLATTTWSPLARKCGGWALTEGGASFLWRWTWRRALGRERSGGWGAVRISECFLLLLEVKGGLSLTFVLY